MYLKYGNYAHGAAECSLVITKEALVNELGRAYGYRERWDILGRIQDSTQNAVNTDVAALQAAYAVNGLDAAFYLDDGTPSSHQLLSAPSYNGVVVVRPPSFPHGGGAEFSSFRNYAISLEAEYPMGNIVLLSFTEAISFRGTGGPLWKWTEPLNGPPDFQQLQQYTPVYASQRGSARTQGGFWVPPGPIWPQYEHGNLREISPEAPSDRHHTYVIHWTYQFSANIQLQGQPNRIY